MDSSGHNLRPGVSFSPTALITVSEDADEVPDSENPTEEDCSIFENRDGLSDDMKFLVSLKHDILL